LHKNRHARRGQRWLLVCAVDGEGHPLASKVQRVVVCKAKVDLDISFLGREKGSLVALRTVLGARIDDVLQKSISISGLEMQDCRETDLSLTDDFEEILRVRRNLDAEYFPRLYRLRWLKIVFKIR
jgi:hypothetical protein